MKKKSAFTFIEVIIAITVFAIGVLAVLRLITQNLVTLDTTQMRTTATFLAKEWMELVYNMRDSNHQKSLPWDCVLYSDLSNITVSDAFNDNVQINACERSFSSWTEDNKVLQLSFDSWTYIHAVPVEWSDDFHTLRETNRLYSTTGDIAGNQIFRYSYTPVSWSETVFARYILFTTVEKWGKLLPPNKILKVESHVLYSKWGKTWDVVLESFIWNY